MPYRRLPNTDNSRLKALKKAFDKGKELPPFKLAFKQSTLSRLIAFLPNYEKAITHYKNTYANQVEKNKEYQEKMRKAKLFISHFIQVVHMAILRGEMPKSTLDYFGLNAEDLRVPALNTEQSIIEWGEKLIQGEEQRKNKGMAPITNPTIALVKVRYDHFIDAYRFQKNLQKNNKRTQDELSQLRREADDIILHIWNEVEESYKDLPPENMRKKAQEYGLVYVYRKNEIRNFDVLNTERISFV
jgi:hypothetical protein